jgi:PEP-CTERM motif
MKLAMAVLAVLMFASVVKADSSIWNITGTVTIPGNSTCGCLETFNFSTDMEFPGPTTDLRLETPFTPFVIPGTTVIAAWGPLFTGAGIGGASFSGDDSTLNFGIGGDIAVFLFPPGGVGDAALYDCRSTICGEDFAISDADFAYRGNAYFIETLVTAPEPATWAMLLAGIALVGLFSSPPYMFRRRISLAK